MSAFAGLVALDGAAIDRGMEASASRALTALHAGRTITRRIAGAAIVQRNVSAVGSQYEDTHPLAAGDGRSLFAAFARLDNREELGSALGLSSPELARASDARLLLSMHDRWSDDGVARCIGAFAFAHWDTDRRRLTLGRDCLGNRALFYYRAPAFVAFATSLRVLLALPGVPRTIDDIALAQFIALNLREERQTLYRGIERVPGRTLVSIDWKGVRCRKYWTPDLDGSPPYAREEDYIERARELLDLAVASAARDTPRIAIATSGGLDSSAIAATAARLGMAESITCFSMVPPLGTTIDVGPFHYLDDRDKLEALARMHPRLAVRFVVPDIDGAVPKYDGRFFARAGVPALNPPGIIDNGFSDAIKDAGYQVVLVGNYGDFGLSWRGPLSLVALLRGRQWNGFWHELCAVAREDDHSVVRTFASNVVLPAAPLWVRRLIYRLRGRDPDSVACYTALNPAFIAESGLKRRWRAQGFDPWFGPRNLDAARWRADRVFDHNQYASDMRAAADEIFGYEVRDPHADRRLLEFALSVPEPMYRRDGVPRSFARRVLADRLPREIIAERRHGVNAPTWFRSLDSDRGEIARDIESLEVSPLASKLIDLPRLKRLMAQWPKDEQSAQDRVGEYKFALARGVHVGRFVRWVEGGNA
jgi:asparagine synthase (glutamine-hydrolysing)